jgi:hypothetical protein
MTLFGSILNKMQKKITDNCEFSDICPYFDPSNFTCINGGGSHCGKYRRFETEKKQRTTPQSKKE